MEKSCEATGKNIEQAVQNALFELKAAREDVDIKILSEGGFLKKARVLVSISDDAIEKYEKKEALKKSETDEDFAENFMKSKAKIEKKEEKIAEKTVKKEAKAEEKEEKDVQKAERKQTRVYADEEISERETEASQKSEKTERIARKLTAEEFLNGVLGALELDGTIEKADDDRVTKVSLTGENLNSLIGHHGDCMFALSHIMSLVCKEDNGKKLVLDVENYREKRQESLEALAKRVANKVAKSGRYHKFEPMPANERRIIHLALQEDERVTTLSKGEEPHRYLMVFPKEYRD